MAKAPNLSCLRTSVLSAAAAWTWWPLRWAKLDMSSQSHTAWALGPSEPPTSVSDGGLWGGASVDRSQTAAVAGHETRRQVGKDERELLLPGQVKLVERSLTPVRQDTEQSGSPKRGPSLTSQARSARSPTTAAHDAKRGGESRETKAARGAGGINLVQAIGESAATNGSGPDRRYSSTPAAQDSGNVTLPPSQAIRDTLPGDLIRQQSADGPCPSSPDTSSTNGNSPGSISAAWETQYMGYPDGWLQLGTEQESWLSATLSSRKSSRRSQQA